MIIRNALLGLGLCALPVLLAATPSSKSHKRTTGLVQNASDAKAIAERETGGKAMSARRVPLNGASGAWEVEVRMPGEEKGWRCVIDADTRMVHTKTRIDQPGGKTKAEGSVRMVHGNR